MIKVRRIGHVTFETPDLERQIEHFTQVTGLVVAAREQDRALLASKLGQLVVQLKKGDEPRCAKQALSGRARIPTSRSWPSALSDEGIKSELRSDDLPGTPKLLAFEDNKGTIIEVFAEWELSHAEPAGGRGRTASSSAIARSWCRTCNRPAISTSA